MNRYAIENLFGIEGLNIAWYGLIIACGMALGFAFASFLWFCCLAIAVHVLGSKINSRVLTWLNRICGVVIVLYSIKLLVNLAQKLFS